MIRRCALIDPFNRSIKEVYVELDDAEHITRTIDSHTHFVTRIGSGLAFMSDPRGAIWKNAAFFQFGAFPPPLAGRGLLVAYELIPGAEGIEYSQDTKDMMHTTALLDTQVTWLDQSHATSTLIGMGIKPEMLCCEIKPVKRPLLRAVQ
jgi:hypothetical protein